MTTHAYQAFTQARDFLLEHRTDYDTAVAGFQWPRTEHFNWALDYFDVMAAGNSEPALQIVDESGQQESRSFQELSRASSQVANWLRGLGVRRGDRVLLMLGNERPLWEAMLAAMKLGAVIVPTSTLLSGGDLLDRFERGGVRHAIVGSEHVSKFDGIAVDFVRICVGAAAVGWHAFETAYEAPDQFESDGPTRASDPLLLYFTSGTTTKPKLVLHSHQSYPVGHLSTMYWIGLQPGDRHLNISSPGWAKHAWSCFFAPWNAGACVFIYNAPRFSAKALLQVLQEHAVTSLCAPPTVYRMLMQEDLGQWKVSLRELLGAGEPLNPEIIARFENAWGLTLRDGFGQTETSCQVGNSPGQRVKPGSMGRPMPGFRVQLLDVDDRPATEGEVCLELAFRPVGLMMGYSDDEAKTADVMREGHYRTGDIARRDVDGYITYVGRSDDVFKASDYRISPFELESVLIEHAAVAEAAVIPSPDPVRLAVPKAVVSLMSGVQPSGAVAAEILRFCRERLPPFKRIRRIEFAELPKTISGKIRRAELRKAEAERREAGKRSDSEYFEEDF